MGRIIINAQKKVLHNYFSGLKKASETCHKYVSPLKGKTTRSLEFLKFYLIQLYFGESSFWPGGEDCW